MRTRSIAETSRSRQASHACRRGGVLALVWPAISCRALQANFYTDLAAFIATPDGTRYTGDIVFVSPRDPAAGIVTNRVTFTWRDLDKTQDQVNALKDTRAVVDAIPSPLGDNAFTYGSTFLDYEQYALIGREALQNIGTHCAVSGPPGPARTESGADRRAKRGRMFCATDQVHLDAQGSAFS